MLGHWPGTASRLFIVPLRGTCLALLVALGGLSSSAQAVVYRCELEGKVVYSDRPCSDDARTLSPLPKTERPRTTGPAPVTRQPGNPSPTKDSAGAAPNAQSSPGESTPELEAQRQQAALAQCVADTYNGWYFRQEPRPSRLA